MQSFGNFNFDIEVMEASSRVKGLESSRGSGAHYTGLVIVANELNTLNLSSQVPFLSSQMPVSCTYIFVYPDDNELMKAHRRSITLGKRHSTTIIKNPLGFSNAITYDS